MPSGYDLKGIFGHTKNLNKDILTDLRFLNKKITISQWNEDPLMSNFVETNKNESDSSINV